jgi:hypothetical protein
MFDVPDGISWRKLVRLLITVRRHRISNCIIIRARVVKLLMAAGGWNILMGSGVEQVRLHIYGYFRYAPP